MADRIAVVPAYDYLQLEDGELAGKLKSRVVQINRRLRDHIIPQIMAIGEELAGAHEDLAGAGKDGQFGPWVEGTFPFTKRTAYNYMRAWKVFGQEVGNGFPLNCEPKAMYRLASPEVPKKAVSRALKLAERGKVTDEVAKQLIQKYTPVPEAPLPDEEPDQDGYGPGAPPDSDPVAEPPVESSRDDSGGPVSQDGDPAEALNALKKCMRLLPAMMFARHRGTLKELQDDLNELLGIQGEG